MGITTTFQNEVDGLLDRVAERYPDAVCTDRRKRLRRFWGNRPAEDRVPYIVADFAPRPIWPEVNSAYSALQRDLVLQLRGIIDHADWDDDYVPQLSTGLVQATLPAYFGAKERRASDSVEVIPVINEPEDVERLPVIGFPPDSHGGMFLAKMRYFHEMIRGVMPIVMADMQGPFSVASQLWGIEPFLLAAYTDPEEISLLCRRSAAAATVYYRLMRDAVENNWSPCHCFPCLWMPPDAGVCLSEDLLAVVSPDTTRQFINPGLATLGEEFGRTLVHTCGSLNHTIGALAEVDTLFGVNCSSSETDVRKLVSTSGDRFCYIIHHALVHDPALPVLEIDKQAALVRDVFGDRLAAIAILTPVTGPVSAERDAARVRHAAEL